MLWTTGMCFEHFTILFFQLSLCSSEPYWSIGQRAGHRKPNLQLRLVFISSLNKGPILRNDRRIGSHDGLSRRKLPKNVLYHDWFLDGGKSNDFVPPSDPERTSPTS